MESLLFLGLISVTSAQFIIYGSNVPQRNPTQPFIIYGNNPQPSFSGGSPPQLTPQPTPQPQPSPQQPILGGNPLQQIFDGGNFVQNPTQQVISGGNLQPQQPILGGNPSQQIISGGNLSPPQTILGGNIPQTSLTTQPISPPVATGGSNADGAFGNSEYHYSWLHDGDQKYNHDGAMRYCNGLGGGWRAVSIDSLDESFFINVVINSHKKMYIWTAGVRDGSGWRWINGGPLTYTNWSFTGGNGQPQPDNREGNENCLGILNNVYRDGIKWHDIACHHTKPVICKRNAQRSAF